MMKKISVLFILMICINAFTGCSNTNELPPSTTDESPSSSNDSQFVEYGVAGNIVDITTSENDTILGTIQVEGSEDNGAVYDQAIVTISPDTKIYIEDLVEFDALEVGMYVNVFFDGPVKESYPVQANAKQVNIIPEDKNVDIPDETEAE